VKKEKQNPKGYLEILKKKKQTKKLTKIGKACLD
jgi:hypothetical protein